VRVAEESGLEYRLGPMSTVVRGSVEELLDLAGRMHAAAADDETAPRILTTIRIDDSRHQEHSLDDRVKVVEQTLLG
jgi:uncharacterized protein YqgV (UPF0045/DUF77 family)